MRTDITPLAANSTAWTSREVAMRLVRAGLLTALIDGLFSSVLSVAFYDSTVARLFQSVAATLLGPSALDGGAGTMLVGMLMHLGVAFGWSTVFLVLVLISRPLQSQLARPYGSLRVAAVYGPLVWMVMSLVIIPFLLRRPPSFTVRWWVQFVGHAPFVGLPIVASISAGMRPHPRAA
ncbi:MAG TPA: hypothetical protein VF178_10910, partial [Gemmatimonadaceae bacterium]